eukprot:scaffold2666_cov562-Prasinococcus_capsulatus_cf.AAC.1
MLLEPAREPFAGGAPSNRHGYYTLLAHGSAPARGTPVRCPSGIAHGLRPRRAPDSTGGTCRACAPDRRLVGGHGAHHSRRPMGARRAQNRTEPAPLWVPSSQRPRAKRKRRRAGGPEMRLPPPLTGFSGCVSLGGVAWSGVSIGPRKGYRIVTPPSAALVARPPASLCRSLGGDSAGFASFRCGLGADEQGERWGCGRRAWPTPKVCVREGHRWPERRGGPSCTF